jgi:von Willebrand factor A domain-containing protein 3
MVSFNSTINPWRDRLTKITNSNIQSQLQQWIEGLHVEGSTNTLAALRFALADADTEAMYLLTDGRPDQVTNCLARDPHSRCEQSSVSE